MPELDALSPAHREAVFSKCLQHSSLQALAKRQKNYARIGWAILPAGVVAYLVLTELNVDLKVILIVEAATLATALAIMLGSFLIFYFLSTNQLRTLIKSELADLE